MSIEPVHWADYTFSDGEVRRRVVGPPSPVHPGAEVFAVGDRVQWDDYVDNPEDWIGVVVETGQNVARVHWDGNDEPEYVFYTQAQLRRHDASPITEPSQSN